MYIFLKYKYIYNKILQAKALSGFGLLRVSHFRSYFRAFGFGPKPESSPRQQQPFQSEFVFTHEQANLTSMWQKPFSNFCTYCTPRGCTKASKIKTPVSKFTGFGQFLKPGSRFQTSIYIKQKGVSVCLLPFSSQTTGWIRTKLGMDLPLDPGNVLHILFGG